MIAITLCIFILLLILGVPIAIGTGAASLLYLLVNDVPLVLMAQKMFKTADSFSLLAIILFMLAGELMNRGGLTERIVDLSSKLVGHITGSLAHVTVVSSMLFATMSGSSAAACASIGSMLIPTMQKKGYDGGYAVGVTSCAAVLGPIIPPSISFIVYASITGDSVARLFLGGLLPGLVLGGCLMVIAYIIAKKRHYPVEKRAPLPAVWQSLKRSIAAILMPVIILGGIMSGVFTATEAGCIGVVYGFIVGFATKKLSIRDIPVVLLNAAKTTSAILMIMCTSLVLGWILTTAQIPQLLTSTMLSISTNPYILFLMIMALILFLGCFLVDAAILPIMVPLLLPVVQFVGYDPIHFGVVFCMLAITAGVTPPVGSLLYIACGIGNVPIIEACKDLMPFLAALLVGYLVCMFCPPVVTFLPYLLT